MQIREALRSDRESISRLLSELDYDNTDGFIDSKIERHLEHKDARLLVAIDEGKILGFISLNFIPQLALQGDFCRISYFCVSEAFRGRGSGAALEQVAEALARERGCDRIEVHCHARRELAHEFYYRQGYSGFTEVSV